MMETATPATPVAVRQPSPSDILHDAYCLAWREAIEAQHPRFPIPAPGVLQKAPPGRSTVGVACVMAEERDGVLHRGIRLTTGDEFWQPCHGDLFELVVSTVSAGYAIGREKFVDWRPKHPGALRLEMASSHIGDCAWLVAEDGAELVIDDA